MLYENESKARETVRRENIARLYNKYKRVGGFGVYSHDSLNGLKSDKYGLCWHGSTGRFID